MTCVVAISQGGKVYMGGDSAVVEEGGSISTRKEPKVFIKNEYIIGYAGSFRFGKFMEHTFVPPKPNLENLDKFFNTIFIDSLREYCEVSKIDPSSEDNPSELLIGTGGRVFEFCNDWHIGEAGNGYNAIGSGAYLALGSLYSTRRIKSPYSRIELSLEAAETFSQSVQRPFTLLEK